MSMDWTPEASERLRALWTAVPRLSTAEIGRRMGVTKSTIVGRAHRMKLPARPSPIRPASAVDAEQRPPRRRDGPKRQGAASLPAVLLAHRDPPEAAEPDLAAAPSARAPRVVPAGAGRTCQWIHGSARGVDTVFCGAPAVAGGSWCAAHRARCFTPRVGPSTGAGGGGLGRTIGWPGA